MGFSQLPVLMVLIVIWDVKSSIAGVANGSIVAIVLITSSRYHRTRKIKSQLQTQKSWQSLIYGILPAHNFCVKRTNLIRRALQISSTTRLLVFRCVKFRMDLWWSWRRVKKKQKEETSWCRQLNNGQMLIIVHT